MHASGGLSENQLYGRWNAWVHSWKILRNFPAGWGVRTFLTRDAARTSALRPGGAQWAQRGARNSVWLRRLCAWWEMTAREQAGHVVRTRWWSGPGCRESMATLGFTLWTKGPLGDSQFQEEIQEYVFNWRNQDSLLINVLLVFIGHHAIVPFTNIVAFNFTSVL